MTEKWDILIFEERLQKNIQMQKASSVYVAAERIVPLALRSCESLERCAYYNVEYGSTW